MDAYAWILGNKGSILVRDLMEYYCNNIPMGHQALNFVDCPKALHS